MPLNAFFPMVFICFDFTIIVLKFLHPENALEPIDLIFFPTVIFFIFLLFLNAFFDTEVTLYTAPFMVIESGMLIMIFVLSESINSTVPPLIAE